MKALLITNAPKSLAAFLVALNIPFRYSYGDFIIENTHDEDKFRAYALRCGVREADLAKMNISVITI